MTWYRDFWELHGQSPWWSPWFTFPLTLIAWMRVGFRCSSLPDRFTSASPRLLVLSSFHYFPKAAICLHTPQLLWSHQGDSHVACARNSPAAPALAVLTKPFQHNAPCETPSPCPLELTPSTWSGPLMAPSNSGEEWKNTVRISAKI